MLTLLVALAVCALLYGFLWHDQPASTAPIKFRDRVGRVTPCAPSLGRSVNRGAHGVTRPTVAAGGVTKLICRCTSFGGFSLSLAVPTEAESDRAFAVLAAGGQVRMPLTKTFWSP